MPASTACDQRGHDGGGALPLLGAALAGAGDEQHQAAAPGQLALGGHQTGGAQAGQDAGRRAVDVGAAVSAGCRRAADQGADPLVGAGVRRDRQPVGPALELVAELVDELLVRGVDELVADLDGAADGAAGDPDQVGERPSTSDCSAVGQHHER